MSIEALRSEVHPNVPISLAVKAADKQFSHDQRVYTNVGTKHVTSTSVSTEHAANANASTEHGTKHGGRNHRNSHHNSAKDAVHEAKSTVEDALSKSTSKNSRNKNNRNRRSTSGDNAEVAALRAEVAELHEENAEIKKEVQELRALIQKFAGVKVDGKSAPGASAPVAAAPAKDADDDFDLFGSDEEEESAEAAKVREERLAAYALKKSKKPGPIAKSSVILDVKPWDDETNIDEMEKLVKSIQQDGLVWGASKQIPVGYGIKKVQIVSTIEDEKVSVEDLIEQIQDTFSDHVQSVDIVAFNKI